MDNTVSTYTAWITIKITHDYFVNGSRNSIILVPTRDTHKLLTRSGVIIRQQDNITWVLLKQQGQNEIVEEDLAGSLEFCLMNNDPGFYYYTNNEVADEMPVWELKDVRKNGIWKTLTIYSDREMLANKTTVTIAISSTKKFLEFLVISKSGNKPSITVKEDNDKLVFSQSQVNFPGEPFPVYRFVTSEPVALKEAYNYTVRLWEVKESGESLLSSFLPFPRASAMSVINSQNTISSYFYF